MNLTWYFKTKEREDYEKECDRSSADSDNSDGSRMCLIGKLGQGRTNRGKAIDNQSECQCMHG